MTDFSRTERDDDEERKSVVRVRAELPEITEKRCHVCMSTYRYAIERMIALGRSYSEISRTFNNEVDRRSIANHAEKHLSYREAAVRAIIEHEAKQVQANFEEGLNGTLARRAYLSTALQKAWDDLVEGNVRVDPGVAIQIIQQIEKMDVNTQAAANEELHLQFQAFKMAVEKIVPRDLWDEIFEETRRIVARGDVVGGELEE